MKEKIEEIIEKYYHEDEEYYSSFRYETIEEDTKEFEMKKELKEYLNETSVIYKIHEEDGFDSPGYANEFLAIAYLDENNELQLHTVTLECFQKGERK